MADDSGLDSSGNPTDSSSSSGISGSTLGTLGTLGVGALGLGTILSTGSSSLPSEYSTLLGQVPYLNSTGQSLVSEGQGLTKQGESALTMAQSGQLTDSQKAALSVYSTGLTNQARQQYYNMGQNPDQSTAFISTTADIDTKVNAMAQEQIQTTIKLGLSELSSGNSLISEGYQFESAADNALIETGKAQVEADKNYSSSLTSAFSSIASLVGTAAKFAVL